MSDGCSVDVEFKLSNQINGSNFRGELLLNSGELKQILNHLQKLDLYTFEFSPEPLNTRTYKNLHRKSTNGIKNDNKRLKSSRPSYSRELKALLGDDIHKYNITSESRSSHLGSTTVQSYEESVKKLPDWAKRFHRVLKMISIQDIVAPFVSNVSVSTISSYMQANSLINDEECNGDHLKENAKRYLEFLRRCEPLDQISLQRILQKLENNEYETTASVFNDVYSVWICGFRADNPGSLLWMKSVEAALNFNLKLCCEPLQDDFNMSIPSIKNKTSSFCGIRSNSKDINLEPPRKMPNLLKSPHNEFGNLKSRISNSDKRNLSYSTTNSVTNIRNKGKTNNLHSSIRSKSITDNERQEFQSLLSQLSQNNHVELFNSFSETAHWREVSSGEVELDDQLTPSNVFRDMILWCKNKLNIPLSSEGPAGKMGKSTRYGSTVNSTSSSTKKLRQGILKPQNKKSQLSAKQFFSTGRAFNSQSSGSEDEDEDEPLRENISISEKWRSIVSSDESDSEPELTSFYPHFGSK
ncbi:hypothetical protein ACR3K2_08010 [Cryptosporidium serpentis]